MSKKQTKAESLAISIGRQIHELAALVDAGDPDASEYLIGVGKSLDFELNGRCIAKVKMFEYPKKLGNQALPNESLKILNLMTFQGGTILSYTQNSKSYKEDKQVLGYLCEKRLIECVSRNHRELVYKITESGKLALGAGK